MNISNIYNFLDSIAPFKTSFDWDNSGFLIGDINDKFQNGLICLDITNDIIEESISKKCNLIISHHPIIFNKLNKITTDMLVYKLIKNNINVISLHTNLDISNYGVNFSLAKTLNLSDLHPLNIELKSFNYKLSVFVPLGYESKVKQSIFDAGGGVNGHYSECCFLSNGHGEFKPDKYSKPFIGDLDKLEKIEEAKIEILVNPKNINKVIDNMLKSHPYETPAYEIYKIYNKENWSSLGVIGTTDQCYSPLALVNFVKKKLKCKTISYITGKNNINKIAVCGGSGSQFLNQAINNNVDAYITSEIKYNNWLDGKKSGITLIDAGHFNTENVICYDLTTMLNHHFKTNKFSVAEKNIDIIESI